MPTLTWLLITTGVGLLLLLDVPQHHPGQGPPPLHPAGDLPLADGERQLGGGVSPAGGLLFTGPEHGGGGVPSHGLEQRARVTTAEELRGGTLPPSFLHCGSLLREDPSLRHTISGSVYLFVAEIGFLFSARRTNKTRGFNSFQEWTVSVEERTTQCLVIICVLVSGKREISRTEDSWAE